jgi:hypothetical protein
MQANSVHHQPITPGSETIMPLDNAQLTIEDFVDQVRFKRYFLPSVVFLW